MPAKPARGGKWKPRFHPGVFACPSDGCHRAGTGDKTRSATSGECESERWDAGRILEMRATPWSPDGSDNAFDIQVGMERPAEMVPQDPGEVLMENKDLPSQGRLRAGSQRGLSRVPESENWTRKTASSQRSMAC